MEEWRDIANYEGLYQVSNLGNIRRIKFINNVVEKDKIYNISKGTNNGGYLKVCLYKKDKMTNKLVHRLVAEAFIPNTYNKPFINHKDFNPLNNNVGNLEWVTQKENVNWSICNMRKRKSITYSNTGEKYITYRKSRDAYRIIIDGKEYKSCCSLEKAIKERNKILNGKI